MKNLFLFLILIFTFSNSNGQFDSSWNNTNSGCIKCDSVKNFSLSMFIYKKIPYPIVDSFVFNEYDSVKYAQSFSGPVVVDSSVRHIFSTLLLKDQRVVKYKKIINGQIKKEVDYKDPKTTWRSLLMFSLFFIFLPILFYCFKYVEGHGFNIFRDWGKTEHLVEKSYLEFFTVIILLCPALLLALDGFLGRILFHSGINFFLTDQTVRLCLYFVFNFLVSLLITKVRSVFYLKTKLNIPVSILVSLISILMAALYLRMINIRSFGLVSLGLIIIPSFIDGVISGIASVDLRLRKKA